MGQHPTDPGEKWKGWPPKVKPPTKDFYKNNKIVTAEEVAEIDRKLAELLPQLKDGQFTPGRVPDDWLSRIKKKK